MSEQERHFLTLQREVAVAAREQGADPEDNLRLRGAIRRARQANMPNDAIERAIRCGTGEVEGPDYSEETFEGYGPQGIAVLVEVITEDRRRTASELADLFESHGGNLGDDGCVAWQFERRGRIAIDAEHVDDADDFMLEVIEMGGEELREPLFDLGGGGGPSTYEIYCDATDLRQVSTAVEEAYPIRAASLVYEATQRVELEPNETRLFLQFFDKLVERPDVQNAYANWAAA